ncbi:hypothetical protein DPMN_193322 [Dreissena polymorpha]|uniref:Uncharacterized protein n=1 Tax=Dreissena polymorpha TaxID=45954 RepID=A0A9D3Y667_DREPO|nr:hypothetical protein DPMN_193322 [Dreissena polymorpha]
MREKITSLLANFENSNVKENKEELKLKQATLISVRESCTRLHNELFHLDVAIHKVLGNMELSFITSIKCQKTIEQSKTYLKENFYNFCNHVFTVNGTSEYNVRLPSDSVTCFIEAICVLPDGQVLVADYNNSKVKLLNHQYQMVHHCGVAANIEDMCLITPSEVAVAMNDGSNKHEVQFITVTHSQLVLGRKFRLQHDCKGIAHHQGDLFITSGSTLYKFSLSGKLVCILYEDKSDRLTGKNHGEFILMSLGLCIKNYCETSYLSNVYISIYCYNSKTIIHYYLFIKMREVF